MRDIIPTVDKNEVFMRAVYLHSSASKDPRSHIGAVLVKNDNIISTGYNGFPRGVYDFTERYSDRDAKHKFVTHAEDNAILTAARLGISTLQTDLFTQGIPCAECMKSVIQAGIKKIIIHKQWPNLTHSEKWIESIEIATIMMNEAGIELECFDKFLGITGFLDGETIWV